MEENVDIGLDLPPAQQIPKVGVVLIALFALYFSIQHVGIIVTSVIAIIFFTLLGGERRIHIILPLALLLPVALYYFFVYVANVPLPLGMFESWR